jgi:hypothetical protein
MFILISIWIDIFYDPYLCCPRFEVILHMFNVNSVHYSMLHWSKFMSNSIRVYMIHNPWLFFTYFEFILYMSKCFCCTQFEFIWNIIHDDCILHNYTIRVYIVAHDPCFCYTWRRITLKRIVFVLWQSSSRAFTCIGTRKIIIEMIRSLNMYMFGDITCVYRQTHRATYISNSDPYLWNIMMVMYWY